MRKYLSIVAVVFIIFLWGCATVPRTSIYTIDLPAEEKQARAGAEDPSLAIHIRSPRYLQQAYIAERRSPYALDISRYSKWDMAPDRLVAYALTDALSKTGRFKEVEIYNSAPRGFYILDVHLREFELSDEGGAAYALISMDVTLASPEGGELYSESFSKKSELGERSFQSLARALSLALEEALKSTREGVLKAVE